MVISFSWNKTIVTTRSNDGEREVIGCIVYTYIYIDKRMPFKGIYRTPLATPSFHAPSRNFFFFLLYPTMKMNDFSGKMIFTEQ